MSGQEDYGWNEVGARIRQWRMEKGWTQAQLASAANLTQPGVFTLERGDTNPQLSTLRSLAQALGRSTRELVCGNPTPEPQWRAYTRRLEKVFESGDQVAIQAVLNGLNTAEVILGRSNLRIATPVLERILPLLKPAGGITVYEGSREKKAVDRSESKVRSRKS